MDKLETDCLATFNRAWLDADGRTPHTLPRSLGDTLARWALYNYSQLNRRQHRHQHGHQSLEITNEPIMLYY